MANKLQNHATIWLKHMTLGVLGKAFTFKLLYFRIDKDKKFNLSLETIINTYGNLILNAYVTVPLVKLCTQQYSPFYPTAFKGCSVFISPLVSSWQVRHFGQVAAEKKS